MNVHIIYYGQARDRAEVERESLDVDEATPVADVIRKAAEGHGEDLQKILLTPDGGVRPSVLVSVNDDVVDPAEAVRLKPGDTIALFTAVAGG